MTPQTASKDNTVVGCGGEQQQPTPTTGSLMVEVRKYSTANPTRKPLPDVNFDVTKGDAKAGNGTTDTDGRNTISGLAPAGYTVTLKIDSDLSKQYDVDPPPEPQTKTVFAGQTTPYAFELRYYNIAHTVTYPDNKPAKGFDWELRVKKITGPQQTLDQDWSAFDTGTTGDSDYSKDYVHKGRYQLRLKLASGVTWSKDQLLVGESIDLAADVTGFDDGTAGTFEIYDARNLANSIHTVQATLASNKLTASWTPAKTDLTNLKSSFVIAQAKVSSAQAFGPEIKAATKTEYDVVDTAGQPIDAQFKLHFSGGDQADANAQAGKAQVLVPWNQSVSHIEVTGWKPSRVAFDSGDSNAQKFLAG